MESAKVGPKGLAFGFFSMAQQLKPHVCDIGHRDVANAGQTSLCSFTAVLGQPGVDTWAGTLMPGSLWPLLQSCFTFKWMVLQKQDEQRFDSNRLYRTKP